MSNDPSCPCLCISSVKRDMLEPGEGNSHSRLGLCRPGGHVFPLCAEPPCSPGSKRQQLHSVEASGYAQGFLSPVYGLPTWPCWLAILQSRNSQGGGCPGSAVLSTRPGLSDFEVFSEPSQKSPRNFVLL